MSEPVSPERAAYLIDPLIVESLDVMGPTIQFLTPPEEAGEAPCVMRGSIPPSVVVPLHSHADPETFLALSGELEGHVHSAEGFEWVWNATPEETAEVGLGA